MTYKKYTAQDKENVLKLWENGKNQLEISRITGVSRGALREWIKPTYKHLTDKPRNSYVPITDFEAYFNTEEKRKAYSYILAVYLCDGCISYYKTFRAPSIRLYNDSKYVKNNNCRAEELQKILPDNSVNIHKHSVSNCVIISAYSRKLSDLFPQHGSKMKHTRKLIFTNWQLKIIQEFPKEFIKGCIESDGCIYVQTVNNKQYKRYSFSNKSQDIIDLFLYSLSLVGITSKKWCSKKGQFIS